MIYPSCFMFNFFFLFKTFYDNCFGKFSRVQHLYLTHLVIFFFLTTREQFRCCFLFYFFLPSFDIRGRNEDPIWARFESFIWFENRWRLQQWLLSIFLALQQLLHLQSKRSFLSHPVIFFFLGFVSIYYYSF